MASRRPDGHAEDAPMIPSRDIVPHCPRPEHEDGMAKNKMSGEEFHRRIRGSPQERAKVFQELHETHYRELTGRFLAKRISRGEAEEYAAEVFLRLWRCCEKLDGRTPPIHYMNRVASSLIADHYEALGTWTPDAGAGDETSETETEDANASGDAPSRSAARSGGLTADIPDEAEDVEHERERFDADEAFRVVTLCAKRAWAAFEKDYPVEADVLMTYVIDGLSTEEVQALLRCASPGAAREKLSQLRKKREKYCLQYCETPDCS